MASDDTRPILAYNKQLLAFDLGLTGLFFLFFVWFLMPHVPSYETGVVLLVSAYTASGMAAVFWIMIQMFRSVYRLQKQLKLEKASSQT